MFSSFKEKLNTSLTSIQEKAAAAAAAGANINHGDQDHQEPGSSSPSPSSSSSSGSIAARISGGGSTSLFRRSLQTNRKSADLISFATSPPRAASPAQQLAANKKLAQLVKQLTLDPSEEKPDPAQLEQVKNAEPAGAELSDSVIERLERLQRYEARFPDLATAFKKLVREKVAIEAVLKASTPLEDMGDVEALEAHLRNMAYKSEVSMQEIKRLSDELREASKMKEVHALESASQSDMIENLQDQLASKTEEIERMNTGDTESKYKTPSAIKETPSTTVAKQQEKIDELESKIKSLEEKLASGTTRPDPLSDPLSDSFSALGTSGTTTVSGSGANSPIAKEKKLAATAAKDQKKKDQALRDLMSRLDTVLKEKKQAQQEQEQAEVKLLQLQLDLDKEVKVKKEMVDKLDQLQKRVGEIEEKEHQDTVMKKSHTNVTDSLLDLDSTIPDTIARPAAIISVVAPSTGNDEKEAERKQQEQQWAKEKKEQQDLLHKVKADLESATQREKEALTAREMALQMESESLKLKIAAEKSLSDAQDAQKSLKDSAAQAERELKIAKVQIKELQKLDGVLDATKKELGQTQRDLLSTQDAKDKVQKEMETLAAELKKEHQEEHRELRKRLEQEAAQKLDQLKLESQNTLKAQETELETLKEAKQDLEKKMEQHAKDSVKADKETQNQLAKLQKTLEASEQTVAELAKGRQDLETKLKETPDHSAELASLSAEVSDKEKEILENKRQIDALTKECTDLEKRLSQQHNISKEVESANAKVSVKEKEVEESKKQIQFLTTEKETLVSSIKKNQEAVDALRDENTKILAKWKGKVDIMEKQVATKAAEVEEQYQEVNALTTEKDEILAKLAVVQELEQNKADRIKTLEAELSAVKQQYQDEIAKAAAAATIETKDRSSDVEEELRTKVIQLEAEIQLLDQNPSKNAQKKLRQELNHTKQAKKEAEALIVTLKAELENAQNGPGSSSTSTANTVNMSKAPVKEDSKDKASDKTVKDLKVQIAALEKSIKDKDNTLAEQQKQLDSELKRQETLQSRVKELERAVAMVEALEQEKEKLTKSYHQLEIKMEANSEEHHTTTASLQKTLKELEIKERQLSNDLEATKTQEKDLAKQLEEAKKQATAALASGNQKQVKLLEQLAALQSEREVLSKKLSDLEKSRDKEITLLHQKNSDLEAAVEKLTKEQERLSSEVTKAANDLEASQKDEQVATVKIAELVKERDSVAEKAAALEKRLEKSQEFKKGQEATLQKQVNDLTQVKAALDKDLETAQTKLEKAVQSSEDSRKEQETLVTSLVSERDEALAALTATQSELKTIQDSVSKIGENQEKVVELTKELAAIKAELAKAEGQLEGLQASTSTEIAGLQEMVLTLETEKESIDKQRSELESQVKDIMAQADENAKLMKVLEEDNQQMSTAKTEAQEKVNDLQSKVSTLTMKDRDTKEALALAKSTIHQRDEDLEATRKEKAEEEDKLQKSMTLLKTTRKQILRLEKEKQEVVEELETTTHATTANDLSRLQAVHAKMVQDKEKIIQEKDTLFDQLQMKHAEFESSQTSLENCEHEMREYRHQLEEARDRVTMLEEETSIAKRLADSKVAEFETLRRKAVELEQKLEQTQTTLKTRADTHKTVQENLQQEVEETKETLGHEIKSLIELVKSKDNEIGRLEAQGVKSQEQVQSLTNGQRTQGEQLDALQQEVSDLKERKRNIELELQHFKDLEGILAQEKSSHEKFVEDSKMREGHLRTVNKTLKEEVRKLQKQGPGSPSASTPGPYASQTPGSNSHYANTPSATQNGRVMSPQSTPPSTPNFGRILQQQQLQQHQDEDVNIEYLKNVLLSFMEHKERRIPVSEAQHASRASLLTGSQDDDPALAASTQPQQQQRTLRNPLSSSSGSGYSALHNRDDDEDDDEDDTHRINALDDEEEGSFSNSVPLRPMNRHPSHSEISIAPSIPSSISPYANGSPGPSTPRRGTPVAQSARRMIQSTMDGVFSNLSAKPRVEKPYQEELPPPYKSAALDVSPAYYETTVMAPGFSDDEVLVDGLPVGSMFGFMWNMIISMSFQFVGFFLTYLLHTSHSTKNGSKMGLGVTFISMGWQLMNGKSALGDDNDDETYDNDTGYVSPDPLPSGKFAETVAESEWLSFLLMALGGLIMVQSMYEFAKAKRTEMVINATSSSSLGEETVPGSAAAGASLGSSGALTMEGVVVATAPLSAPPATRVPPNDSIV
ncbi:hypothetical protein BG000_006193 [Podila horticola]|nr:hypothetical protein BG000_006193 [Podila horticola]